jgi:alpha-amylase/alpha-mannosidase (GH57 family)
MLKIANATTIDIIGECNNRKNAIINFLMDYETCGEHQGAETGIFTFLRHLPERIFSSSNSEILTPAEDFAKYKSCSAPACPLGHFASRRGTLPQRTARK